MTPAPVSGRCYCGHTTLQSQKAPHLVAFCHCRDCKRWTGSPAPAFASFDREDVVFDPPLEPGVETNPGVLRWNCQTCGSPLAAYFDYIEAQLYIPLGLLDQADDLPASLHCHAENTLPWLHIEDEAERAEGTARDSLIDAGTARPA